MALNSITRKSNQGRDVKYLSKDFASFRKNLIEYSKSYFPKTMITAKRLENSVCQGMKELGVNCRLYQKNPEEYPEI